jgi:hypothetical protein
MDIKSSDILDALRYTAQDGLAGETKAKTTEELASELGWTVRRVRARLKQLGDAVQCQKVMRMSIDKRMVPIQAYYLVQHDEE